MKSIDYLGVPQYYWYGAKHNLMKYAGVCPPKGVHVCAGAQIASLLSKMGRTESLSDV